MMEQYYYSFTCEVCYEKVTAVIYLRNLDNQYNNYIRAYCEHCHAVYYLNRTKLVSYYVAKDEYLYYCDVENGTSSVGIEHTNPRERSCVEWIANFDEPMNPKELMKRLKTILVFS